MSWLFGIKPRSAPPPQGPNGGQPPDGEPPQVDKAAKDPGGHRMAYSFDSTALERAAKAAKDLEASKYSRDALELAKLQEKTRQLEYENSIKDSEARVSQSRIEERRVFEEERRKTLAEESRQMQMRAEYQDQLARKRFEDELVAQKRNQAELLREQEESIRRQEELRKATLNHELKTKHRYDLERIEHEALAKGKADRENRDIILEQLKTKETERRTTVLEAMKTGGQLIGTALDSFTNDFGKVLNTAAGVSILALGVYAAKNSTAVVAKYLHARLGKPSLIRDTSRITPLETLKHPIKTVKKHLFKAADPLKAVVLHPALESRLRDIAITTKNTKKNNGIFRNFLFYGPPGTGKTMFARGLAAHSSMDYAIMTGGDVVPLGSEGVSEIHKVFDWAASSRKGMILFIDEADAFLRKRSTEVLSENMRATLNAFLYRTGDQSSKFSMVLASNQPEQFDWAVNDRLDEMVEFSLPTIDECKRMLLAYFDKYIAQPALKASRWNRLKLDKFDWVKKCDSVASDVVGLSGREIAKMVIAWQASAYASEDGVLREWMIDERVKEAMQQHEQKMQWLQMERAKLAALLDAPFQSAAADLHAFAPGEKLLANIKLPGQLSSDKKVTSPATPKQVA